MKLIRTLLLLTILLPLTNYAQKTSIMFTYSQSKFLFSPGLEANYFFHPKLGFQAGVSSYFLDYNTKEDFLEHLLGMQQAHTYYHLKLMIF